MEYCCTIARTTCRAQTLLPTRSSFFATHAWEQRGAYLLLQRSFKTKSGLVFMLKATEQLTEVDRDTTVLLKRKDDSVYMQPHIISEVKYWSR
jgi:hypothetical protein